MNKNGVLKERLKSDSVTIGSWVTIGHTIVAEIMAKAGFDWLAIDMEHSAITIGPRMIDRHNEHSPIGEKGLKLRIPAAYQAADHRDVRQAIA